MLDIVIISVPGTTTKIPPAAPAVLKAAVLAAGFSCKTIDFNIKLCHHQSNSNELQNFFCNNSNLEHEQIAHDLIKNWVQEILQLQPTYVGISVFTYQNRTATKIFCKYLKQLSNVKIILGGQGLQHGGIQGKENFAHALSQQGLCDHWIKSEGEKSLVELLKNNTNYIGIGSNDFDQNLDLNALPYPNYDDYVFDLYDPIILPVTGSRGCVRSCTFCDIHEHWNFASRTGQNIVDELVHQSVKYGISKFYFTDSLINGNYKEFYNFINLLSDYNENSPNPITWSSQFIIRSIDQSHDQYWKLISNSGASKLFIGVETGSDQVRQHMNKKFSNLELDYSLSMMHKYNISCEFLMIVGYPTETELDFNQTLEMFEKYKLYAGRTIKNVSVGSTLAILPGTNLYVNASRLEIDLDKNENNWISNKNPDLTLQCRLERLKKLVNHLKKLNYPVSNDNISHVTFLESNLPRFEQRQNLIRKIKVKKSKNLHEVG